MTMLADIAGLRVCLQSIPPDDLFNLEASDQSLSIITSALAGIAISDGLVPPLRLTLP